MKRLLMAPILAVVLTLALVGAASAAGGGFDQFGYNYQARIFVGTLDGADRSVDGTYWGDPTYAKDRLVMKWSKAWDDARFHGAAWTADAWVDNEFNGNVPGGSGTGEHVKIVWVGKDLEKSPYWRPGGYALWGEFEAIFDHYTGPGGTGNWLAHAVPAGYGSH